ncbi:MAG: insulinase family protein [Acidobacteria bacterium]|nr:insulinase family protein [Acidobacteriota bacterium]
MIRNRILVFAAALAVFASAAHAVDVRKLKFPPLGEIVVPEVTRTVLPNGMVLMLVEDHELPLVHFQAMVRAGDVYQPEGNPALPEIFGEVLRTGGTVSMTGDKIDEVLESIGASVETSLGASSGGATARCLADQVDRVLPILAEVLMHPGFRQDKIDLAKTQARSGISRRNDDPFDILSREYGKLLYGAASPYARQVEYADVDALTREDLLAFHRRFYHPNGVILGARGDFDPAAMKAKIESAFAAWPRAERDHPPLQQVRQVTPGSIHYVEKTDIEQSFILLGHLGIRWDDPDLPKIQLMNDILGASFSSRMFRIVRTEKGLAYATGGALSPAYDHPGTFYSFSSTKFGTTHETLTTMQEVIQKFREEGITDAELATAKESFLNSFAFQFDSPGEVLGRLMTYEYYGYPADFLQKFRAGVEAVTTAGVLEVARKHIHPEDLIVLVIGDASRFDRPLTDLGQVARIDITIPEPGPKGTVAAATPESLARGQELAARAIDRLGGQEPLGQVQTLTTNSSITMVTPQGEFQVSGRQTVVFPHRVRLDIDAPFGKVVEVLDGENGWTSTPQGVSSLPEAQAAQLRKEIRFIWLALLRALVSGDIETQSLGSIRFEDRQAEDLYLRFQDGTTAHLYVDAGDLTPLGIRRMGTTLQGPAEIVQILSDFRDVGRVRVPFSITTKAEDRVIQEIRVSEARVNADVDSALFARPEE